MLLLHGWPYDIHSYVDVAPILAAAGLPGDRAIPARLRHDAFPVGATPRNGQQAALAVDAIALMDALGIERAVDRRVRLGRPHRRHHRGALAGALQGAGLGQRLSHRQPGCEPDAAAAQAELQWWYQYYFATERGEAGYAKYTSDFARLIWELASPQWRFDEATFARSAAAFDNPDHVAIVDPQLSLAARPRSGRSRSFDPTRGEARQPSRPSRVPTITIEGDANGAPHPEPAAYAKKFTAATSTG